MFHSHRCESQCCSVRASLVSTDVTAFGETDVPHGAWTTAVCLGDTKVSQSYALRDIDIRGSVVGVGSSACKA